MLWVFQPDSSKTYGFVLTLFHTVYAINNMAVLTIITQNAHGRRARLGHFDNLGHLWLCKSYVLSIPLQPQQASTIRRRNVFQRGRGRAGELPRSHIRQEKSCKGPRRKPSQRTRVNSHYSQSITLSRTSSEFKSSVWRCTGRAEWKDKLGWLNFPLLHAYLCFL